MCIFNPLVLLWIMALLLQLQPKWFLLRGICFGLKNLVWIYFEHNAAFAFSYCSLSLTVSETFLEEFGVAFFYSEHHWFMSCCKVQWLLKNTIVTLKRWLWLCVFCSHHNNSLQVIIKLEIFFVFLTKKIPFLCQRQLWVVIFLILQKIFLSCLHAPPPDKEGLWHSMTGRVFCIHSAFDFSF